MLLLLLIDFHQFEHYDRPFKNFQLYLPEYQQRRWWLHYQKRDFLMGQTNRMKGVSHQIIPILQMFLQDEPL